MMDPARIPPGGQIALAFLLPAAVIGTLWYVAIGACQRVVLREGARELEAVAELKIGFIETWLAERRADAPLGHGGAPADISPPGLP